MMECFISDLIIPFLSFSILQFACWQMTVREADLFPVQIEPQRQAALDAQVVALAHAFELLQLVRVLRLNVDHQIHRLVLNQTGLCIAVRQ